MDGEIYFFWVVGAGRKPAFKGGWGCGFRRNVVGGVGGEGRENFVSFRPDVPPKKRGVVHASGKVNEAGWERKTQ